MQRSIVIIAPDMRSGGSVGAVAWRHALELSRSSRVFALTRNVPPGLHPNIVPVLVQSTEWNWLRRFAHVPNELSFLAAVRRELRSLARREPIDVVWCHSHAAVTLAAAPLQSQLRYGVVMTTHGDIFDRPPGTYSWDLATFYRAVTRRAYRQVDRVHALSPYMADCAVRGGAERSAVRVVPNGIGAEDIGATNLSPRPAESFMRGGTLRLLYVGSLWNVKGVDVLIRSVAALARSRGDASVQLDLVGNGPSESLLRKLVASLAMKDVVRFPGRIPRQQLAAIYAGADVLCTPSLSEAFSIVTLEAMLCGLPVVGSNTGGIPMLVDDGQSGHLAIAGDVGSLAQCLTAVSASREHLATLGARGFAKVRRQFSWDIITVELDRLAAEVAPVRARQEPQ